MPSRPRRATTRASSGWRSTARSRSPATGRSSPGRSPRAASRSATTSSGSPRAGRSGSAGLHRHDRPVERIGRGARAAINLVGVHHAEIRRGQELAAPGYLEPTRVLSVEVRASGRRPAAAPAPRPIPAPPRDGRGRGDALASSRRTSCAPGGVVARPALPGRAGRRGLTASRSCSARRARRRRSAAAGCSSPRRAGSAAATAAAIARLGRLRVADPIERARRRAGRLRASQPWTERDLCREAGPGRRRGPGRASPRWRPPGALVELPVGPRRTVRVLAEVAERPGRPRPPRPGPAARGAAPAVGDPPQPRRGRAARPGERRPRRRRSSTGCKAAGQVVADARTVALAGHEPKLSQGGAQAQGRAGRGDPRRRLQPARGRRSSPPRRRARAAVVPELLALLRDEEQLVEIGPRLYLDFDAAAELRRRVVGTARRTARR